MKKRILAIGAHPDDIEIGCAGTLSLLQRQGFDVIHLIVTSGEEGHQSLSKTELKHIREAEALRSAGLLGTSRVLFLGATDGLTAMTKEMKISLIKILRELRPDIVFTHASSDHFPDHQVVHELTMSAVLAATGPWYSDAPEPPHKVSQIYGYEVWNPIPRYQLAVDISAWMEIKLKALSAHQSQTAEVDYLGAVKGLAKYRGTTSMSGEFAEVFEVLRGSL